MDYGGKQEDKNTLNREIFRKQVNCVHPNCSKYSVNASPSLCLVPHRVPYPDTIHHTLCRLHLMQCCFAYKTLLHPNKIRIVRSHTLNCSPPKISPKSAPEQPAATYVILECSEPLFTSVEDPRSMGHVCHLLAIKSFFD